MVKYNGCSVWPEDRKPCISLTLGKRGSTERLPQFVSSLLSSQSKRGLYLFVALILILRSVCDTIGPRALREQRRFRLHVQRADVQTCSVRTKGLSSQMSSESASLVAALLATHFEDRQKCVRWSLFSIALLTLLAWARHARAVMVNERRWGIVDPSVLRRSWRTTPPLLLQWLTHHLTTQTSQSNCITRCFQGETVENWNSDQMEVCLVCASRSTCVDVYTARLCSCSALSPSRPPGRGEVVFFVPPTACVSAASHGWRCWSLCDQHTSHRWTLSTEYINTQNTAALFLFSSILLSHAPPPLPWDLSAGMFSPPACLCVQIPAHLPRS